MRFLASLLLVFVMGFASVPAMAQTPKLGSIYVENDFVLKDANGNKVGSTVSFTLINKDGDAVASASLGSPGFSNNYFQRWDNVPPGKYELHIDTLTFGSIVKRIGVLPGASLNFAITDMPGDGKQVVQGKPTIADLQKQIADLNAKIAALTAKLAELQKAK